MSCHGLFGAQLDCPIGEVMREDVRAAMAALKLAPRTVRGYYFDVATVFNYAVRREYLARSPAQFVELPVVLPKPPARHSPAEVRRVLLAARAEHPNFCRELAVRYFAGIRSAEVARLTEAEISADYIEVTAAKSKTRRRRLVAVSPNLRAWLAVGGRLPVGRTLGLAKLVATRAKVPWPSKVTRHSFCSYHLAHFGNAGRTALEAGHTGRILCAH